MLKNIIIEGVDRLGKSTLIQGIKDNLGYFLVVHYMKPEYLRAYQPDDNVEFDYHTTEAYFKAKALERYQRTSMQHMLSMLSVGGFLLDRAHLGEAVYSHRYRKYDGNYVFGLEQQAIQQGNKFADNTLLVLLTTSDFSYIKDDGGSLDFSAKEDEQEEFKIAFTRSAIKHKLLIDVANGEGFFKPASVIRNLVVNTYIEAT